MKKPGILVPDARDWASLGERVTQFVSGLGLPGTGSPACVPCCNAACGRPLQAKVPFCPFCGGAQSVDTQEVKADAGKGESGNAARLESRSDDTPGGHWLRRVWPFSSSKKP